MAVSSLVGPQLEQWPLTAVSKATLSVETGRGYARQTDSGQDLSLPVVSVSRSCELLRWFHAHMQL